jgi:membrane-associated phospholipid phosphatase
VQVAVSDAFGQQATGAMTVTRGDVVIAWNKTALDAAHVDMTAVGLMSRNLAMVSGAVYDAVNSIDQFGAAYHANLTAPSGASAQTAASQAAYTVLVALYPTQKARFDATLAQTLGTIPNGPSKKAGRAVGVAAGEDILAWRANDGSSTMMTYTPGTAPGQWQPTPPDYMMALEPMWGKVAPFGIPSAQQFLPPPPPPLNSPAYTAAFNEVKSLGAVNSTTRTPQETQTGLFWAYDLPGATGPPPIHYNQIAEQVALEQHNTLDQNARMFALVDVAMADAAIEAWYAKYTYNFWRPVTAIPNAGSDGNPNTVADPTWMPLGAPGEGIIPNYTPPFPAYISGHATFGGALFQTLADFYGNDHVTFTITSDELPGVARTYTSFSAAAEENGQSRIYLGIHWSFDKTEGIATGDSIANYVFAHDFTNQG